MGCGRVQSWGHIPFLLDLTPQFTLERPSAGPLASASLAVGMVIGSGRFDSIRYDPCCLIRIYGVNSYSTRTLYGSTCTVHTGSTRPVTNHETNWVDVNLPRPLLINFFNPPLVAVNDLHMNFSFFLTHDLSLIHI